MHRQQVAVELLVGVGVEVVGADHQRDVVAEVRVQQQAAQHALFGIEVVRRQAVEYFGTDAGRGRPASVRYAVAMAIRFAAQVATLLSGQITYLTRQRDASRMAS